MLSRWLGNFIVGMIVIAAIGSLLATLHIGGNLKSGTQGQLLGPSAPDRGLITVWSWNVAAKSLRSLLPAFRQRHRGIDVDVEMNGTNVETRFLLSLSAGTGAPDVMQLQAYEAPRYIATGRLSDLTAVAKRYERDFPAASWASCVSDGRVYAIPWDLGPCGIFFRQDLFTRYGVDVDHIGTWDDFIGAGRLIVQRSGGRTKMMPLGQGDLAACYEMLLQQVHGQVFDDAGQVAVNSAASRRVLNLMRRMLDAGICANVNQFSQEWMAGLSAETIAFYPGAVWLGGTIKDTTGDYGMGLPKPAWRVARLPAFDSEASRVSNLGGSVLVIPDQSAHKAAAWAFIEFALCNRANQVAQYANFDLFPAFLPALTDPFFDQPDPFYGNQKVRALFADGVDRLPILNRTSDWVEATDYLNQSFTAWAANHSDTSEMLEQLSRKLSRRLDRRIAARAPAQEAIP